MVDGDEPEPWAVALSPLEVVEQRPGEVAGDREAAGEGALDRGQVERVIANPIGIIDLDFALIRVVRCGPALGDHDVSGREVRRNPVESILEPLGMHRPAESGAVFRMRLRDFCPEGALDRCRAHPGSDPVRVVVVEPEEVDGRGDQVHIPRFDHRARIPTEGWRLILPPLRMCV